MVEGFKVQKILIGTLLSCLNVPYCGRNFRVSAIRYTDRAEFIQCPYCGAVYDIVLYHKYGEPNPSKKLTLRFGGNYAWPPKPDDLVGYGNCNIFYGRSDG